MLERRQSSRLKGIEKKPSFNRKGSSTGLSGAIASMSVAVTAASSRAKFEKIAAAASAPKPSRPPSQCMSISRAWMKRVFLLGPSHSLYSPKCLLSACTEYATPMGNLPVDGPIMDELAASGLKLQQELSLKV